MLCTGLPKLREAMICCFGGVMSSSPKQLTPRSSQTMRSITTPKRSRKRAGGVLRRSSTVCMSISPKRRAVRWPTPQTSRTSVCAIQSWRSGRDRAFKSHTPSNTACFLARWLANLAKVLVGPMPTHTGKPVHWRMRWRICRPKATPPPCSGSTSSMRKKLSSML